MKYEELKDFYQGKTVLVTGHTGFKGSWMCAVLLELGANVIGYALKPDNNESLFDILGLDTKVKSIFKDIRDREGVIEAFKETNPDIAIHMAAQPIVRESYKDPAYTYETNVMGTVNFLEAIRLTDTVKSVVNVTTDKVYLNKEWQWGYRENEELNGYDPYSNSKSCSELVTSSYINSYFREKNIPVSTCRAGNVIGGGDFAKDRIIPDCVRAAKNEENIVVRNPYSTRPYQHVLEPVVAYLMVAMKQYGDMDMAGSYNVGPNDNDCWTTGDIVTAFCEKWNSNVNNDVSNRLTWINQYDGGPHEAGFLKLDCSKIKNIMRWQPAWSVSAALDKIVEWNIEYFNKGDMRECVRNQIDEYFACWGR